jgi:hypothetical protein
MVRAPETGSRFRLPQSDWLFELFWEQIIRGGVIPLHASRGLEYHSGRTVLIETPRFEERWRWKQKPGPKHRDWISLVLAMIPAREVRAAAWPPVGELSPGGHRVPALLGEDHRAAMNNQCYRVLTNG